MKEIEYFGLKVVYYYPECRFDFDSYTLVKPNESSSGCWEVWETVAEGSDEAQGIEDVEFIPTNKLLEIQYPEDLTMAAIHAVLCALNLGFYAGQVDGSASVKRQVKYAVEALTGAIDGSELEEAADEHAHWTNKNRGEGGF